MLRSTAIEEDKANSIVKVTRDVQSKKASFSDLDFVPLTSSIMSLSILDEDAPLACERPKLEKKVCAQLESFSFLAVVISEDDGTSGNSIPANFRSSREDVSEVEISCCETCHLKCFGTSNENQLTIHARGFHLGVRPNTKYVSISSNIHKLDLYQLEG